MKIETPDWVRDAIFYQIFPDRFARSSQITSTLDFESWNSPPTVHGFKGGDLSGIVERLDYLIDLGINAIYLNPIFSSAANHRYHTFDYFNVDPLLGGNDALRKLLDEAHNRNIRIILDGVFNHASRGFWQFHHVLENGADSPYANWFHFHPKVLKDKAKFQPYPSPQAVRRLKRGMGAYEALGYQSWWNLPALPKFNTDTPAVREFLFSVAEHWIDFGIDGWRLDVPNDIDDDSFWQEFRTRVKHLNPDAYIVGEIWGEAKRWLQGDQFDAVMNYPITKACLGFFGGKHLDRKILSQTESMNDVRKLSASKFLERVEANFNLYSNEINEVQLNLLDSHDMPRFLSCVSGNENAYQLSLLFLMTIPGTPCIYYGDEIGMQGKHDPDCRRAFPWNAEKYDGENQEQWNQKLLDQVKRMIQLRKDHVALRRGTYNKVYAKNGLVAHTRQHEDNVTLVAFNMRAKPQTLLLAPKALGYVQQLKNVWPGSENESANNFLPTIDLHSNDIVEVNVPPLSGVVYSND